ncbi:MAG TPA: GAF domain-containing protein [Mycobacterium sp.]|nr:GAF domain-containing protein [Mycobacterium sp.]
MSDTPHDDASDPEPRSDRSQGANVSGTPRPAHDEHDPLFVGVGAICHTAARLTGVDGAAVAVLAIAQGARELVYATDAVAQQLDELQFTLGEGPCLDAVRDDEPQLCARIDDEELELRWPAFTAEVADAGVAALFAYPVPGPQRPMGVLELYRRTAGELGEFERQSAQVCASALRTTLEINWRDELTRTGSAEAAIEAAALRGAEIGGPDPFTRSQVYVAAGMVAVQLGITTHDAVDRLRAYAYAHKRSIVALAADVVARRLSFRDLDDESSFDS